MFKKLLSLFKSKPENITVNTEILKENPTPQNSVQEQTVAFILIKFEDNKLLFDAGCCDGGEEVFASMIDLCLNRESKKYLYDLLKEAKHPAINYIDMKKNGPLIKPSDVFKVNK